MLPLSASEDPRLIEDGEIVQRLAAGDDLAFEPLMRRYNRRLFRTARSIVQDDAEAEDVLQEAYLQAYRGIKQFRGDARLPTWLTRIVINEAIMRRRKNSRRAEVIRLDGDLGEQDRESGDDMESGEGETTDDAVARTQVRRLLESKIDQLPESFRTVFILRAVEDMSVEEVSIALGIPEATVRSRHFRAKSLLREALSRELDVAIEQLFGFDGGRCDRIVARVMDQVGAASKGRPSM